MDPSLISLKTASEILSVPIETLLKWNEFNILKPTITSTGQVGYRQEQITQFLTIRNPQSVQMTENTSKPAKTVRLTPLLAFVLSFISTTVISQTLISNISKQEFVSQKTIASSDLHNDAIPESPALTAGEEALKNLTASDFSYSQLAGSPLATAIISDNVIAGDEFLDQAYQPNILLILVTIIIFASPFLFKKHTQSQYINPGISGKNDIILELNQKGDGSIVICFQNREIKISKPELDSESDQFIERLMELVAPGIKEVDYDSSKDQTVNLVAPLSKLVTRLGFVGLKRDLFFPRTSKNRVLFRRYITQYDLAALNLDPQQINNEILVEN